MTGRHDLIGTVVIFLRHGLVQRLTGGCSNTRLHDGNIGIDIRDRRKKPIHLGTVILQNELRQQDSQHNRYDLPCNTHIKIVLYFLTILHIRMIPCCNFVQSLLLRGGSVDCLTVFF